MNSTLDPPHGLWAVLCDRERGLFGFLEDVAAAVDWVKSSPPAPGGEGVMVAGDPERRARADRMANGITIDDVTWKEILEAAATVGVGGNRVAAILGADGAPATPA